MEKVSCEIVNSSMGPDHAKIQISELKITLKKYGKEFYAKEQARTKKCGNSLVCWSIVKQLFKGTDLHTSMHYVSFEYFIYYYSINTFYNQSSFIDL